MTVIARVSSMQVKDEALDELSFRAVEKFNAYMDDIEGDFSNRFRYGIASTADGDFNFVVRDPDGIPFSGGGGDVDIHVTRVDGYVPVAALRDALKLSKSYPDTFTRFTFRANMAYVEDFSETLTELEVLSISLVMSTFFDEPEFSLEALVDNIEESILEFPLDVSNNLYNEIFGDRNA